MPVGHVGQVSGAENLFAVNNFTSNPAVPEPNLDSYQTQMPTIVDALIAESGEGWQNGVWHIQPGQAEQNISYIDRAERSNSAGGNNTIWGLLGAAVTFVLLICGVGYLGTLQGATLIQDNDMLRNYNNDPSLLII
ncbi:MAG: hypothetical protein ABH859_02100 [Pseudomonadota bacterium]